MAFGPAGSDGLNSLFEYSKTKKNTTKLSAPQAKPSKSMFGGPGLIDDRPYTGVASRPAENDSPAVDFAPGVHNISVKDLATKDPNAARNYDIKYITREDLQALGLDESYIGLPYSVGYTDQNGAWVEVKSALEYAKQLHDMSTLQSPEIIQLTQTPEYEALSRLIAGLEDGSLAQQDFQEGTGRFEELLGLGPGGLSDAMSGMRQDLNSGVFDRQGFSDQYIDTYNRQTQVQLQQMRDDSAQLMESLGASGRSVQGYSTMLNISRSMADFQAQRQLELTTQDNMVKQAEYDALKARYDTMYQMQQVTVGEYVNALSQNRLAALQGYAQQITAQAQQNQTNIAEYEAHAQVMYQTIMAQLGVDEGLLSQAQDYFEMYMAPTYAELEKQVLQSQVDESKAYDWMGNLANVGGLAATGASIGSLIPGIGTAIGAAIGAGVGIIGAVIDFFF